MILPVCYLHLDGKSSSLKATAEAATSFILVTMSQFWITATTRLLLPTETCPAASLTTTTSSSPSSLEPAVTLSLNHPVGCIILPPRNNIDSTCLFHTLPTVLFYTIVSYIAQDPIDLVRLQLTCRDWYQRLTPLQLNGHPKKKLKRGKHDDNHDVDDENGRFLWQHLCHKRYKVVSVVGSSRKLHPPDAGWWLEWQRRHAIDVKVHGWLDQLLVACCCRSRDGGAFAVNHHRWSGQNVDKEASSFKACAAQVYSLLYDIMEVGECALDACTSYRQRQRPRLPPLQRFGSPPQQYTRNFFLADGSSLASSSERDNDDEDDSICRMRCWSNGVIRNVKHLLHVQRVCRAWSSGRSCCSTEVLSAQHLEDFLGWIHQALDGMNDEEALPCDNDQERKEESRMEWNLRTRLDQAAIEIQHRWQQARAYQQMPPPPQVILHHIVQHMTNHSIGAPLHHHSNMRLSSRMSQPPTFPRTAAAAAAAALTQRVVRRTPAISVKRLLLPSHELSTTYDPPSFQGIQQQPEQGDESQGEEVHCLLRAMVAVCLGRRLGVDLVIEEREQRGEVRNDDDAFFIRLLKVPTTSRDSNEIIPARDDENEVSAAVVVHESVTRALDRLLDYLTFCQWERPVPLPLQQQRPRTTAGPASSLDGCVTTTVYQKRAIVQTLTWTWLDPASVDDHLMALLDAWASELAMLCHGCSDS